MNEAVKTFNVPAADIPLKLDGCSYSAARCACRRWHYSRSMPAGKMVRIGVWEAGQFIGCMIFSRGANPHAHKMFKLQITEMVELTRVALDRHHHPVSQMLAIAMRMLKRLNPGLKLILSYSDLDQDHHGGIYQAGSWIYLGKVEQNGGTPRFKIKNRVWHGRSVHQKGWKQQIDWIRTHVDPHAELVYTRGKHKYIMPLTRQMRRAVLPLSRPYPKRAGSIAGDAPESHPEKGGSNPTPALKKRRFTLDESL